jgi:DNA repair exonuclease SbcCD ATPase subunit
VEPAPTIVQEKIREWVKTKKQIGEERSHWDAEKQSMTDLNELRRKEIAQIDELIAAAGARLADAEKQRTELLAEEAATRAWRASVEGRIGKLEADLRAQLPKFPPPLREKIGDAIQRLENPQPDTPLQNRYRDVLAILGEAGNFQNTLTIDTELREIGGIQVEVDVLYLGLAQAWYVDRTGRHAGSGRPDAAGWQWTDDAALASRVRDAIAIQRKQAAPAFIGLPFQPATK